MIATLNGLRVVSVRIVQPYRGVWFADVDLDPDAVASAPTSGKAVLTIGTSIVLNGTVDPRASGHFVASAKVRLVGGGGGWDKTTTPQHWHQESGVLSTQVYAATGLKVGEIVVDATPISLGQDFVRSAGPASRVFLDRPWFVDLLGITHTGARSSATLDASAELLSWDPLSQLAELSSDAIIMPGTVINDVRIGGSVIVRDVEQTFDGSKSRAFAWCSSAAISRLAEALKSAVREFGRTQYLASYRYRFVTASGDGLALQAVSKNAGLPDQIPVSVWSGMSGISATLKPSTEVIVDFVNGDPSQPIVRGFAPDVIPLTTKIAALTSILLGTDLAMPVVLMPGLATYFATLEALLGALAAAIDAKLPPTAGASAGAVTAALAAFATAKTAMQATIVKAT